MSLREYNVVHVLIMSFNRLRGRVQAFYFGKTDFELGVRGEGQDTFRHFEGSFGSIHALLPMQGLGAKTGAKFRIFNKGNKA